MTMHLESGFRSLLGSTQSADVAIIYSVVALPLVEHIIQVTPLNLHHNLLRREAFDLLIGQPFLSVCRVIVIVLDCD